MADSLATLRGLFDLTRAANAVVAGVLTFVGAFVAGGARSHPVATGAAVLATVVAVAAGNAINDYFDREVDRINNPERPIPRGAVSPRGALAFSGALFAVALVAAVLALPPLAIGVAAVNLVALVTYTEVFKGTPGLGNALVAYLGGSTFLFGAAAVGNLAAEAGVLFALAALSTLARELVKDVEDVAGDRAEGLRTLPVAVGERPALLLAAGVLLVAVAASPVPYVQGTFGLPYLALVVPADAVMVFAAYRSFTDPAAAQRVLKYGMVLAAAAFVVGRAARIA